MMLLTMGQFRHWLLAEVNSTMVSRLVSLEVFVTGPSYEGQRFVAALSTEALKRGEVKVLGTTTIVPMMSTGLENGAVVKPWMVDSFAADTPSVSVALMGVTLALCHAVVPSRNVSPAAKKFIASYYERVKGDQSLCSRVVPAGRSEFLYQSRLNFEQPSLSSAYLDLGYIDAKAIIAQGIAALKHCARLRGRQD